MLQVRFAEINRRAIKELGVSLFTTRAGFTSRSTTQQFSASDFDDFEGDVIRLRVRPEVSTLDFSNGVTLFGFCIPALVTRRAETDVELRDGQSFAIAGLLDNLSQSDEVGVPFLSKLPIIGNVFKSRSSRAEQTELLVLITPRLVRPLDPDEVPPLPTNDEDFLGFPDVGGELENGGGLSDGPFGI